MWMDDHVGEVYGILNQNRHIMHSDSSWTRTVWTQHKSTLHLCRNQYWTKKRTTKLERSGNQSRKLAKKAMEPQAYSYWSASKNERQAGPESQGTLDIAEQKLVQLFQRDWRIIFIICNVMVKTFLMVGFMDWTTRMERMAKNNPGKTKTGGHENQHGVDESLDVRSTKVP